jgi:hypothetical protein
MLTLQLAVNTHSPTKNVSQISLLPLQQYSTGRFLELEESTLHPRMIACLVKILKLAFI